MVSKLGPMYQGQPERGSPTTEVVRNGQFEWVKGMFLARFWIQDGDLKGDDLERTYWLRGAEGAEDYVELLRERLYKVHAGGVRYVSGVNEPVIDPTNWMAFEAFERRRCELVASIGLRPVWGSMSVGTPGLQRWNDPVTASMFTGSVQLAIDLGGMVELHEYGAPTMDTGDGSWTLRYRYALEEWYSSGITEEIPIFIGECGIDGGLIGDGGQGWKHYTNQEDYWAQLAAYDNLLLEDPEIQGASAFITNPNDSKWASFDVAAWLLEQMAIKHGDAPPDPEPPGDCGCEELKERVAMLEQVVKELCYGGADRAESTSEWLDNLGRMIGPREG